MTRPDIERAHTTARRDRPRLDTATIKRALRQEFEGWSIIHADRGRWWAMRTPPRDATTRRLMDSRISCLEADTPEQLAEKFRVTP